MWAQRPPDFREVFLGGLGGRGARGTGSGKFQEEGYSWVLGQPRPENLMTLHRETTDMLRTASVARRALLGGRGGASTEEGT